VVWGAGGGGGTLGEGAAAYVLTYEFAMCVRGVGVLAAGAEAWMGLQVS
jgi:hypothetical protein